MTGRRPWRRAMKRIAYGVLAVIALLIALAVPAPLLIRGARFGTVVGWMLPATRGKITVGGGRWSWGAVWELLHGRPAPLDARRPARRRSRGDRGAARRARHRRRRDGARSGAPDPARPARQRRPVALRDHARRAQRRFPGRAMQSPRPAAGPRACARARQLVRDPRRRPRRYRHHLRPSRLGPVGGARARARQPGAGAPAPGRRRGGARAPPVIFTFDVSDADLGGGGVLRILDGRARVELPFSAGPHRTRRDHQRRARRSAARRGRRRDRRVAAGRARRVHRHLRRQPPAPAARHRPARAPRATPPTPCARSSRATRHRCRSPSAPPTPTSSSASPAPSIDMKITAAARGFDLGLRDLDFRGVGFDVAVEPTAARARVSGLTFASPAGGRLTLDAELDHRLVHGALALDHFATAPYLPSFLRPLAGGVLDGRLRGAIDLAGRSGSLDELALTLARPAGTGGPRRLRLTSARGRSGGRARHRDRAHRRRALRRRDADPARARRRLRGRRDPRAREHHARRRRRPPAAAGAGRRCAVRGISLSPSWSARASPAARSASAPARAARSTGWR